MHERIPRLLLILTLFLAGCMAAPEPAPNATPIPPSQTFSPSPTLVLSPTTTLEDTLPNPTVSSDVILPTLYYILDNLLYEENGERPAKEIASLADGGQLLAAYRAGDVLLVMRENGIQRLRLSDGRSELLYRFDKSAFFGDILPSSDGRSLYFTTVVDDLKAEFGMGSIVGMYDLVLDTIIPLISLPENTSLLGGTADGSGLYLLYHGQDPSLVKIVVVDTQKGVIARELAIRGDSFASLAPDGDTLAVLNLIMPTDPSNPTQQVKSQLYVYHLGTQPGAAHQVINLPDTPLHLNGNMLWSPDSRTIYVLLVSGNYWEDPAGFLPFGLWQLNVGNRKIQQLSNVSETAYYLEGISTDGEWLLLRGQSQVIWVNAHTGAQKAIDFPGSAFLVEGQ